jgi:2-polyprenyl-3-methyl-5-hydroxy-6-metoxy-1,4-benzoquinol methylase
MGFQKGEKMKEIDTSRISDEVRDIWDTNAPFWDEYMGEGKHFQHHLIGPTTERLLELQTDETVLDIACGNGLFSRRMAALGAHVVAFDFSQKFIECAKAHTTQHSDRIEYQVIDATDPDQLLSLGERRFDAAVCSMALMDMADIDPLLKSLPSLLKPNGRFVFSILHPCFNSARITKVIDQDDHGGELVTRYSLNVLSYITPTVSKGLGVIGQPVPQYYFHRPLSTLLTQCFKVGFLLDRFEEPVFKGEFQDQRPFSWVNFKEIPPVFVARMRISQL